MSKKGKWILALCVSFPAFGLIRKLLIVLGMSLIGEIVTYLFLAVVGFIGINILIPEKCKGWANLLPILCALIFLVMGIKAGIASYDDENKKAGNDKLTLTEESDKEAVRILANMKVKWVLQEQKLLSQKIQKKSSSSSKNQGNRVEILPPGQKPEETNWGKKIATQNW